MGKVKVTSKNNQVKVQIKSSNGEQLNQNMVNAGHDNTIDDISDHSR